MFKLVIGDKGKAWKLELESEVFVGKIIGDRVQGKEIKQELEGYELEITGGSDSAGFPHAPMIEGLGLKRVLLTRGFGMRDSYEGIRRRKTVRGKQLSASTAQINLKVIKAGGKKLSDIFPEQNQLKAKEVKTEEKKVEAAAAA